MTHSPDWVPAGIRWNGATPLVEWCHLGDLRATDPFFEQTLERAMRHPFNLLFRHRTPLHELATEQAQTGELNVAGFVFHMSRCGSTVVSQMLAALERNVVLSEPTPLDQVLRLPSRLADVPQDQIVALMRGMVAALGRKRRSAERDLFVKFDAWHVLLLPLIRRAFPTVPWVFVYREPLEVLSSLARLRPAQMFPNGIPASVLSPAATACADFDEYAVQVLACYLRAAIAIACAGDGGLLVEYQELPETACTKMLAHFGLQYTEAERAAMREAALHDAKNPGMRFRPDGAAKRQDVADEVCALAETHLAPLYAQLEVLRRGAGTPQGCAQRS
jgi:hypothetical protein